MLKMAQIGKEDLHDFEHPGYNERLDFIKPIMVFYLNCIKPEFLVESKSQMSDTYKVENLKAFIDVAPSLNEIEKGIKIMKAKEVLVYKILLDILGSYLRMFKGK